VFSIKIEDVFKGFSEKYPHEIKVGLFEPVLSDERVLSHVMFPGVGQDEGRHLPGLVNLGVLPTTTTGLDWLIVEIPTKDFSGKEKRKINFLENDEDNTKNHVVLNFHAT
jgi:hypothetical protein